MAGNEIAEVACDWVPVEASHIEDQNFGHGETGPSPYPNRVYTHQGGQYPRLVMTVSPHYATKEAILISCDMKLDAGSWWEAAAIPRYLAVDLIALICECLKLDGQADVETAPDSNSDEP